MSHIYFALHLIALFSGIALLSALLMHPKAQKTPTFKPMLSLFSAITSCLFASSAWLYFNSNIEVTQSTQDSASKFYLSYILIFLAVIHILISWHNVAAKTLKAPTRGQYLLLAAGGFYGVISAVLIWWFAASTTFAIALGGIIIMLASVIVVSYFNQHTPDCEAVKDRRKLTAVMITQSVALTLGEVTLLPNNLLVSGTLFSLPVSYFINLALLWRFQYHFLNAEAVPLTTKKNRDTILSKLTPKEQEVALCVAQGLSNKEIARELTLSPSTVKNHLYNIFKKCEISNRVALLAALRED